MSTSTIRRHKLATRVKKARAQMKLAHQHERFLTHLHNLRYPKRVVSPNKEPINLSEDGSKASIFRYNDLSLKNKVGRFIGKLLT